MIYGINLYVSNLYLIKLTHILILTNVSKLIYTLKYNQRNLPNQKIMENIN